MSIGPAHRVEVIEKAAVDALLAVFTERYPGQDLVNHAAGGGQADPVTALRVRLRDDSPDGFQVHPGGEVVYYADAGHLADLNGQFARWGLFGVVPTGHFADEHRRIVESVGGRRW